MAFVTNPLSAIQVAPILEPVASITRLGFRKWYERQLLVGHAALVACILCMVAVAICLEEFTYPAPLATITILLVIIGAAAIAGWKCWLFYHHAMMEAWRFGESSVCKKCELYGRFVILASGRITPAATDGDPDPESEVWMNVACKKCGHHWRMPD